MNPAVNDPATNTVWAELCRRGLGTRDLAEAQGVSASYIDAVIKGTFTTERVRRRIEAFLRTPVWTSPEEFAARVPRIEFFGDDIEALTKAELVKLCAKHGLLDRRRTGLLRRDVLARLARHFEESTRPKL